MDRQQRINAVRGLLDFLEANPDVEMPFELIFQAQWGIYSCSKDDLIAIIRAFGTCKKVFSGDSPMVEVIKDFGGFSLSAKARREEVCERIVVGTEEVPERVIPEEVIPASVREIVEWRCSPILEELEASA